MEEVVKKIKDGCHEHNFFQTLAVQNVSAQITNHLVANRESDETTAGNSFILLKV